MQLTLPNSLGEPEEPIVEKETLLEACRALSSAAEAIADASRCLVTCGAKSPKRRKRGPRTWISERYAVVAPLVEEIVGKLGSEAPALDSFADS